MRALHVLCQDLGGICYVSSLLQGGPDPPCSSRLHVTATPAFCMHLRAFWQADDMSTNLPLKPQRQIGSWALYTVMLCESLSAAIVHLKRLRMNKAATAVRGML